MKQKQLLIVLFTSFLLASCQNNNINQIQSPISGENDLNENDNQNISQNFDNSEQKTQRLSYEEYISKYGENIYSNEPIVNEPNPPTQTQDVETEENLLATFSTPLLSSSDERINNIEIVCGKLNDFILYPKETFSYNDTVGPYGPSDGFEEAPILLKDGTKTEGYGGGVCQLSSTLYNVVKAIDNLDITERHEHSSAVGYVKKGNDATVSLQSNLDLKFVNNTSYPIKFKANCENNKVSVWAYKMI